MTIPSSAILRGVDDFAAKARDALEDGAVVLVKEPGQPGVKVPVSELGSELTDAQIGDKAFSTPPSDLTGDEQQAVRDAIGASDQELTDAAIGDTAFSNPPADLSDAEKEAARDAIGAGTGDEAEPVFVSVVAVNADHAVLAADRGKTFSVTTGATDRTITLPSLQVADNGFTVGVRKADSGAGAVVVTGVVTLADEGQAILLQWNGAAWLVVAEAGRETDLSLLATTAALMAEADTRAAGDAALNTRIDELNIPSHVLASVVAVMNADRTVTEDDRGRTFSLTTGNADRTVTLPDLAANLNGFTVVVRKADEGSGLVEINDHGDNAVASLSGGGAAVLLQWTGSAWVIAADAGIDHGEDYVLPASTEAVIGGVRNVSVAEAGRTDGTVFRAWSSAMITKLIALWRVVVPQAEAEAGSSDVPRFWSAVRVRQAINAVVPAVFRTGSTARIDPAKLGTGVRGEGVVLHGDGAWRREASGLMREVFNLLTGANVNEQNLGIQVPDDNNVVLLLSIAGTHEFIAGDDFVALRESDAHVVNGVTIYSNADRDFLLKQSSPDERAIRIWEIEDVEAFAEIAARFLPTVSEDDALAGTSPQRRIWNALRVWQAARAATGDAVTGLSVAGNLLTGRRRSGTNPVEVALPTDGSLVRVGDLWHPAAAVSSALAQDTGIPLPANPDDDRLYLLAAQWGGYAPVLRPVLGRTIKALETASTSDEATDFTTVLAAEPEGPTALYAARSAAGTLLVGNDDNEWVVTDFASLYEPLIGNDADSGLVAVGNWSPPADVGTGGNPTWQATGIILPASPADDTLFEWYAVTGGRTLNGSIRGKEIKALTTYVVGAGRTGQHPGFTLVSFIGGSSLYAAKDAGGQLLLAHEGWTAATDYFYLYRIQADAALDVPGTGYVLWQRRDAVSSPAFSLSPISSGTSVPSSGELRRTLLTDSAQVMRGAPLRVDYLGALHINKNSSGSNLLRVDVEFVVFRGISSKQFTRSYRHYFEMSRNTEYLLPMQVFNEQLLLDVGTEIPVDGGGTYALTDGDFRSPIPFGINLVLRGSAQANLASRQDITINLLDWSNQGVVFSQIPLDSDAAPAPEPSITEFTLGGDSNPIAGDIAGARSYETAISRADHVAAARIVGFTGTSPSGAVTVLKTLAEAEFAHSSGNVTLPSVNLAADEIYTVRLEVYTTGQAVGTDTPTTHQDRRIIAQAQTASVRFFRIPRRVGDPAARPTAANLIANATVISTAGTVIGSWTVAGIPNDGGRWLVGWIVPEEGTAQPNHYVVGGINNDHSVDAPFDLTESGVDYKVYMFIDDAAGDDLFNGVTIQVS